MEIAYDKEGQSVREQLIDLQLKIVKILASLPPEIEGIKTTTDEPFKEPLQKKYVYGLKGLADILGCSKAHAQTIKSSGILDKAIIQNGRKIIVDAEMAITLFQKRYE